MQAGAARVQAGVANFSAARADCRLSTQPEVVSATGCPAKTPVTHMRSVAEAPSVRIPLRSINPASVTSRPVVPRSPAPRSSGGSVLWGAAGPDHGGEVEGADHVGDPAVVDGEVVDAAEVLRERRIELRFRSPQAAETLLAFGPDAEVLTPEDLRRALARRAAAVVALYAPRPGHLTRRPGPGHPDNAGVGNPSDEPA